MMATLSNYSAPGYEAEAAPDLSRLDVRERLSQSAMNGFFAICAEWKLSAEQQGGLLGDIPRSSLYKLKTAAGTLSQDRLTRISYLIAIYKALNILLSGELAHTWITRQNDNHLFGGQTPLHYMLRAGIPGFQQVRRLLDAARGGA